MKTKGWSILYSSLRVAIGLVWFVNGLFCKVLGWVPRHEEIVARILGDSHAAEITLAIGLGETALAVWIWVGLFPRSNAVLQMVLVATMNVLEFFIAPDLLLWGRMNALFAAMFIGVVFVQDFIVRPELVSRDPQ